MDSAVSSIMSRDEGLGPVEPIPLQEGPDPLAPIAYPGVYKDATSCLRGLQAKGEKSSRAMDMCELILEHNSAHYTAWDYRAQCVASLSLDPRAELEWSAAIAERTPKNFQVWRYRQIMLEMIDTRMPDVVPDVVPAELDFIAEMLEDDAKNYHVWSHRQWVCRHFDAWDRELAYVEQLLDEDVLNNSAYSHRWLVRIARHDDQQVKAAHAVQEIEYVARLIRINVENNAAWNYLTGLSRISPRTAELAWNVCKDHVISNPDNVAAWTALTQVQPIAKADAEVLQKAYKILASKDDIRREYWQQLAAQ